MKTVMTTFSYRMSLIRKARFKQMHKMSWLLMNDSLVKKEKNKLDKNQKTLDDFVIRQVYKKSKQVISG